MGVQPSRLEIESALVLEINVELFYHMHIGLESATKSANDTCNLLLLATEPIVQ